jgi:aspartate racemase
VGLLGTRFTIENRMFGCLEGIETVMPDGARIERIHELYKEFVDGRGSDAKADELRKIAREFVSRDGAQSVLIAGTDLSNVFTDGNAGFPMIDCARVHIDAIVRRLLD